MPLLMSYDDFAWERSKSYVDSWLESLYSHSQYVAIKDFILEYHPGKAIELKPIIGGCNIIFQLIYKDMSSAVLRIPIPGLSRFLDEKMQYEVATIQWLKGNTSIPEPTILHRGSASRILFS
jgi:hypothetical protein